MTGLCAALPVHALPVASVPYSRTGKVKAAAELLPRVLAGEA